jgi:hypothetical protein
LRNVQFDAVQIETKVFAAIGPQCMAPCGHMYSLLHYTF